MKKLTISLVVAFAALTAPTASALGGGTVQPQGWCDVAPWLPFCAAWR